MAAGEAKQPHWPGFHVIMDDTANIVDFERRVAICEGNKERRIYFGAPPPHARVFVCRALLGYALGALLGYSSRCCWANVGLLGRLLVCWLACLVMFMLVSRVFFSRGRHWRLAHVAPCNQGQGLDVLRAPSKQWFCKIGDPCPWPMALFGLLVLYCHCL